MPDPNLPSWLAWAREIEALAQTGYHYAVNDFQRERYERLTRISAEMIGAQTTWDPEALADVFRSQVGYATPKIDVRGAVFSEGRLLLVREISDGGWTMPGGWADVGDIPSEAAEREVWEEAGFRVSARKVIGVYDANRTGTLEIFHAYKLIFLCDLVSGEARASNETSEVAFFGPDEIPASLSGERTHPRHLDDAFAALNDPNCPTRFD